MRFSILLLLPVVLRAESFQLPTANRALFEPNGETRFFVPTVGKTNWTSGCFGCVRSDGWQMHEGLDIRCLKRDKRGEPIDPVMATADGKVAYINTKPSLSNYGNYIVLRHTIDGIEIYSTYAHLREIQPGLKIGDSVKAGETIATMGRTSNTHEGISKERAHVHFELGLFINEKFPAWYKKAFPGQRNDHGQWNGQNLVGLDPRQVLLEEHRLGSKFNLLQFIHGQTELCRVLIRDKSFPWLSRYAALVRLNPKEQKDEIVGYEIVLNFNGVPIELIPRAASEVKGKSQFQLLSVNEAEQKRNPCRKLVTRRGTHWELTTHGENLLRLLVF
jgi:murein DD-endopeptidase MepM/ murein hydrolase activator NlpD